MTRSLRPKVVVLGMMSKIPVSGVVWQTLHYLVGLDRLGIDAYYVEAHARTPSMLMTDASDDSSALAAGFVDKVLSRFGLGERWAFQALHDDGRCFGMDASQLSALYRDAALIINLHGGTLPLPEHVATGRLVYLETDPVQPQIELFDGDATTADFLDQHAVHFTFAENLGSPTCTLPWSDRYDFLPTRQPVVLDWWDGGPTPPGDRFTTIANWHQPWRTVRFGDRDLGWSKDAQYRPLLDLPSRSPARLELALANCGEPDRLLLEGQGWHVRSAAALSDDLDAYREYIQGSRGEFSVAKEQNVVFRTGWFSDRSATYLASGRPVIMQDTGFGEVLPTGSGLLAFSSVEEAAVALDSVRSDYDRHAAGARDLARSHFSHDVVLGDLLAAVDLRTTAVLACSAPDGPEATGDVPALDDDLVLTALSKRPLRLDPATRGALAARRHPSRTAGAATEGPGEVRVSIVVPVRDRIELTQLCLESILSGSGRDDYEIVVVDDASTDGTAAYLDGLSRVAPRVTVHRNPGQLGFAGSVNRGIDASRGRSVVIANNDTVVGPAWMEGLLAHLDDPGVGMAVASTTTHARNCRVAGEYSTYGEFTRLAGRRLTECPEPREITMGPLFFAALRRDVIDRIGPLDEQFEVAMFEDDDYCARLVTAGYRIVCATDVLVHHFGEGTLGDLHAGGEFHRLFTTNRARFERKWLRTWESSDDHLDPAYEDEVAAIRTTLAARIPAGDVVAVVSRGDASLVDLDGPRGRHLPANASGGWSGHHPADSVAARTSIDDARTAGANWFFLPSASSWWLGHYDGLDGYLGSVGSLEHDDDLGRLYRLVPPAPPERTIMDLACVPSACTIISRNYLGQAKVLADSYLVHHPAGIFYLLAVDGLPAGTDIDPRIRLVALTDLPLDDLGDMCFKYDVVEFATAVKPALLLLLLEGYGEERVMYIDPDILVTRPMVEVAEALDHADIVLTPHLNAPIPLDDHMPREQDILISGAYNLGFIAVRSAPETMRLLEWWRERLQDLCRVDPENGLMVDQRWIDLVPSLFPTTAILRDDTYNVAYWNLHARAIEHDGAGYTCNGRPLAMFHFSGYDPKSPNVISKHQTRSDIRPGTALRDLFDAYGVAVLDAGYLESKAWGYGLDAFDNGIRLHAIFRRLYLDLGEGRRRFGDPLAAAGPDSFFTWATMPDPGRRGLSPFLETAYRLRYDIQAAFPDVGGTDRVGFLTWAEGQGAEEFAYEPIVAHLCSAGGPVPGTAMVMATTQLPVPADPTSAQPIVAGLPPTPGKLGINVCGYLRNESGLGAAARSYIQILEHLEVPLSLRDVSELSANRSEDTSIDAFHLQHDHPVNLVCINADQHFVVRNQDPAFFADRYNIGVWFWELPSFPDEWRDRFEHYDEIWVGSSYIANALTPISPIPVVRIMPVLGAPQPGDRSRGRRRFGVADEFVFLFMFDCNSYIERKNPVAVIDAFRKAFPGGESARLVIKSVNGEYHTAEMALLEDAVGGDDRIMMLTDYLESSDMADLTHACDCYVSLHRAEGTGLTMAHAMAAGKPVIATGWSGNTDFMDASNSLLVRFDLVELHRDVGPYKTGGIWADPDVEHASALMRHVFDRPDEAAALGAAARETITSRFSVESVGRAAAARLEVIAGRLPRSVRARAWTAPEHGGNASLMTTIRAIVADNVHDDRPVIVISKGDPVLADLGGPLAWHFPQDDDGVYAGYYPNDSATAVAHLERLHEKGAGHFLVPATSSWWLRHYEGLRDHLDTRYTRVAEDGACVLYRLELAGQPAPAALRHGPEDGMVEHLRETLEATGAWVEDLAPRVASTQLELAILPDVLHRALGIISETMAQMESDVDGRLEAIERSHRHLSTRVETTSASLDQFARHVEETRRRDTADRDAAVAELARRQHEVGTAPAAVPEAPALLGAAPPVNEGSSGMVPSLGASGSIDALDREGVDGLDGTRFDSSDERTAESVDRRLAVRPFVSDDWFTSAGPDGPLGFSRSDDLEAERLIRPTFADLFRGDPALVSDRQRLYLPFFTSGDRVVDLGCGRGEFLELLTDHGVQAEGVERSGPLARAGRRRGLEIQDGDALEYLKSAEAASLDGVFSAQFVEHLEPSLLAELLVLARRVLRPGGTCIAETVNPENFEALKTFHVDLTHQRPIFPQVLVHLFWEAGFECAWVFYPLGGGFSQRSYDAVGEYAVVARA